MPTAKEIIIRLINEKVINGEEAYVLLNAILQSEMMEAGKVLDESKKSSKKNNLDGLQVQPYTSGPYTTTTGITGTGGNTITCDAANANSLSTTSDLLTALSTSK